MTLSHQQCCKKAIGDKKMPVTRINNNQVTDASAGNTIVGINAGTKLQNYSITATKIANNLTYGSDLTITGNLTVQGNTTAIDTTTTTIEDPLLLLASTQTGAPSVDIGYIGERGTSENIAFVWDESASEFVTAFTSTTDSNTTITITSYANARVGNMVVGGTTSLSGNVIGTANFTGNVNAGNVSAVGTMRAASTVGGVITGSSASVTGGVTAASVAGGVITGTSTSVTGTQTAASTVGGVITGTSASVTGGVTAASVAGGVITGTSTSVTGTQTAASTVGGVITGSSASVTGGVTAASVAGGVITGTSTSVTGTQTAASTVGGVITGTSTSVTGTQTAASTVGGVITGSNVSVSGNVVAAGNVSAAWLIGNIQGSVTSPGANTQILFNDSGVANATGGFTFNKTSNLVTVGGNVNATNFNGNVFGTSVSASGTVTAASTVGGVITGTSTSVTGTQTAASTVGGVITGSSSSVTGTQTAASTVGGVITGSSTSVTGSQTAASTVGGVITGSSVSVTGTATAASTAGGVITGSTISTTGNITGPNVNAAQLYNATAVTVKAGTGNINLDTTSGNIVVNNTYINGVQLNPVQNSDVASKYYVDLQASTALTFHSAVQAATTTTLATTTGGTITYAQPNGVANGVGATLTTTGSFNLIDTANVQTVGTRILVKNEGNGVFNGVYTWSNATVITRATDADVYGPNDAEELSLNDYFFVAGGNVNVGSAWVVDAPQGVITFGTSNIQFAQFSQAQIYSANTSAGLSLIGTVFSAKVDNNTTAFDGQGNISVKAGANLTTPNIGAATGTSLSVTGTVTAASTVGGVITGTSASVTGGVTAASVAGGVITGTSTSVTGTQTAASTVGGVITGTSASVTGGVTAASVAGGVITGTSTSVTGSQTAASTVGGVITGTSVSVSGNVTAGNTNSNLYGTTVSASGTVTAASTVGGVITGTSTSVTGTQTAASTVGGVITGSSVSVTGGVTAASVAGGVITGTSTSVTGTQTAASTVGGVITGTSASLSGNVTGGNILTSGNVSATGNVTGAWLIGNIQGSVTSPGANTQILFNDSGVANATAGFTFNKTSNLVTVGGNVNATNFNGNVFGTSVSASGTVTAASTVGGVITGSSASVTGTVTAASTVGGVITGSTASLSGNITGANLILSSGFVDGPAAGRITINGRDFDTDFAVDGNTAANVFYVDAGTGTASFGNSTQVTNALVSFQSTNSIRTPVGNTAQRPSVGVTGMLRFNTTTNAVEVYDNSQWTSVGVPVFTVIADQQFAGDGSTVAFTLGSTQTTNSCIVSINGVVQIPTLAYAVAGTNPTCVLTFTEAPAAGDVIDVRQITTTTTVTQISNSSGNAAVSTSPSSAQVNVTGDLSVSGSILGGNINSTAITNGTSNMSVVSSGGNIRGNVGGTTVMTISPGLVDIVGDLTVSGNATLSGNILGDRVQNGTTSIDIQTPNGNANISIAGTSNVAVFTTTGVSVAGNVSAGNVLISGNIVDTNALSIITGSNGNIALAPNGSGIVTVSSALSATGNITGGNLRLGSGSNAVLDFASANLHITNNNASGNITLFTNFGGSGVVEVFKVLGTGTQGVFTNGDITLSGNISDTGALNINTGSNGNLTLNAGSGSIIINSGILNGQANATGNIGSATSYFNTIFAKATSAQYADLAEKYTADAEYAPGTVVQFGGSAEVTLCVDDGCARVAGVVSTNPSYRMNDGLQSAHTAMVALTGRVPTSVTGTVRKGDMMVSAGNGTARAEANPQVGTVIGKALADSEGDAVIEVVVGRV